MDFVEEEEDAPVEILGLCGSKLVLLFGLKFGFGRGKKRIGRGRGLL